MSKGTGDFIVLLLAIPSIMIATTIHEFTRALVSTLLGDNTPRNEKRLTINPLNHFEPIGFLLMFSTGLSYGVGFGWGKPVNTNPRHYQNRRMGVVLAATIPTAANLLMAVLANVLLMRVRFPHWVVRDFFELLKIYNIYMVVCNFFPVAPFDCLKIIIEFVSRKNYFSITQQESVMQLVFMLLLFSGLLTYVSFPLYSLVSVVVSAMSF